MRLWAGTCNLISDSSFLASKILFNHNLVNNLIFNSIRVGRRCQVIFFLELRIELLGSPFPLTKDNLSLSEMEDSRINN